jgi:endonuclease/exonuclease/phosphatase family metal-dependent hydrolase
VENDRAILNKGLNSEVGIQTKLQYEDNAIKLSSEKLYLKTALDRVDRILAKEDHDVSALHEELRRVGIYNKNVENLTEERKSLYGKLTVITGTLEPTSIAKPLKPHTIAILNRAKTVLNKYDTNN